MLDAKQLAAIELAMAEEHRRDKEALDRMKRFIRGGDSPQQRPLSLAPSTFVRDEEDEDDSGEGSIRSKVAEVFDANPDRRWTIPQMVAYLNEIGFTLKAQRPEATMYGVFQRLRERGRIRIVRRGTGRTPHTYRSTAGEAAQPHGSAVPKQESNATNGVIAPSSQKVISFLQANGPSKRMEIIQKSGIPAGTIANVLTRKDIFRHRQDGKWELVDGGIQLTM